MAAASGTSTWSCLWKSAVSLQDTPCFSRGQTDELNGNMTGSPVFSSLGVTLISTNSQFRDLIFLLAIIAKEEKWVDFFYYFKNITVLMVCDIIKILKYPLND